MKREKELKVRNRKWKEKVGGRVLKVEEGKREEAEKEKMGNKKVCNSQLLITAECLGEQKGTVYWGKESNAVEIFSHISFLVVAVGTTILAAAAATAVRIALCPQPPKPLLYITVKLSVNDPLYRQKELEKDRETEEIC